MIRGQVKAAIHDSANRDITQFGWRATVADHAVGQHREVVQPALVVMAVDVQAQAPAAVHVVDEDELATIGFGFC